MYVYATVFLFQLSTYGVQIEHPGLKSPLQVDACVPGHARTKGCWGGYHCQCRLTGRNMQSGGETCGAISEW